MWEERDIEMKELLKKKSVRIGLLVILLLVIMGIVGINTQSAQRREEYNGHVEAAEKYLSDLDYEQAIAEYILALEIDPKSEDALSGLEQTYLAYARSYADTGDYERAIDILEEGYAVVQRESLREQTEEYRELQQIVRQEAEAEIEAGAGSKAEPGTGAAPADDIREMVESDEFERQLLILVGIFAGNPQNITDEQVRELCWSMIEALERYRELYPENGWYYEFLPHLYYLVGEYELCAQLIKEFRELFPDNNNLTSYYKDETTGSETTRDEYGRVIGLTAFYYDGDDYKGKETVEYEYGQNGKKIRQVSTNDTGRIGEVQVITTSTWEYEYDSEGRLSKMTLSIEGDLNGSGVSVTTYEYSGEGFTTYENAEGNYYGAYRITSEYVIDEYGWGEMVGEPIYEEMQ